MPNFACGGFDLLGSAELPALVAAGELHGQRPVGRHAQLRLAYRLDCAARM
jgi:hypothetical protein